MILKTLDELLSQNPYPGRGIMIGTSASGKSALLAYFIMGRSENSRNRVFRRLDGGLRTEAYDLSKVSDPSLILYDPYRSFQTADLITNGDQTNTVCDFLRNGKTFRDALMTRCYEPDTPHYTPRIAGMALYDFQDCHFTYELAILKRADDRADFCERFFYTYEKRPGVGHLIHTYQSDGAPLPSFVGEPRAVLLPDSAKAFGDQLWDALNCDNKISLFVREVPLDGSPATEIIYNKNRKGDDCDE